MVAAFRIASVAFSHLSTLMFHKRGQNFFEIVFKSCTIMLSFYYTDQFSISSPNGGSPVICGVNTVAMNKILRV